MTDLQELKNIAERCKGHQPLRFMRSHGALYFRNDKGIVFDVHQNRSFPEFMAENKDYADLVLAANPAAVLELIAELKAHRDNPGIRAIQSLRGDVTDLVVERDKLKAENESLRKDAERYRWFRNQHWDGSAICAVVDPKQSTKLGAYCPSEKLLDEAIDAALTMSKEASHG